MENNELSVIDLWANSPRLIKSNQEVAKANKRIDEKAFELMEKILKGEPIIYIVPYGK